jgi:hypothetical protein
MNARKHRKIRQATRDCSRLGPKGKQSGPGPSRWPDANIGTAGVKSEPKSSGVKIAERGKAASLARLAGQTPPQGGSGGAALGRPKKPMPACNAPDMPTSVWSELARTHEESPVPRKANDDRRSSVDASRSAGLKGHARIMAASEYCQVALWLRGVLSSVRLRVSPTN